MSDVREKIKRAEKHLDDFKIALRAFVDTEPYSLRVDMEPDPLKPVVHILKADPLPPATATILGDAIHNLRSALDYFACVLVRSAGNSPGPHTEFPILDGPITTSKREARFVTKVQGMQKEVIQAIRDIHPYKGGNDTLWRLHRFDAIDKHNMLVTAFGNITAINSLPPIADQWNGDRWGGIPGIPAVLKEGDQFSLGRSDLKVDKGTKFFAEVVFNEPSVAEGYPVVLALPQFLRCVKQTIGSLSWGAK